jgi:hypothetical protein
VTPPSTVEERAAHGRAARAGAPRSSQAAVEISADRDPIAILEAQNASRVPELVPIRFCRMLASPLAFFRGAAALMARDLAPLPSPGPARPAQATHPAELRLSGRGRDLLFDLNDFDETLEGPFRWDVKRLAASVEVAARRRGLRCLRPPRCGVTASPALIEVIRLFAAMGDLDV